MTRPTPRPDDSWHSRRRTRTRRLKHARLRRGSRLRRAGLPVVAPTDDDGRPVDGVKVGTVKRAKGLELEQVLLPDVRRDDIEAPEPPDGPEHERWTLRHRELYVGMTRARDGLWMAVG